MTGQSEATVQREHRDFGLRANVLSGLQVLGQSVAGIGPTIGAVSLIPLAFADAGYGAWLTVVIASIGVLAVGVCIARVAGSHFSSGALYNLVPQGLGATVGFVTGWVRVYRSRRFPDRGIQPCMWWRVRCNCPNGGRIRLCGDSAMRVDPRANRIGNSRRSCQLSVLGGQVVLSSAAREAMKGSTIG
jgi:hypothetical protein